ETHSAPADHDEGLGKALQRHRRRVVEVAGLGETWDRSCPWRGARGRHDLARSQRLTSRESSLATGDESGALLEQSDGRVAPHDQDVKLAAASCDHTRRLGHWPPPGAFVVSGRMVAPNPVSLVR